MNGFLHSRSVSLRSPSRDAGQILFAIFQIAQINQLKLNQMLSLGFENEHACIL
jgi:hypothetical protein